MTTTYRDTIDLDGRLHQLFLDVDELASDLVQQVQHISADLLNMSSGPELQALLLQQSELVAIYQKLNNTRMVYHEYYVPYTKDSN